MTLYAFTFAGFQGAEPPGGYFGLKDGGLIRPAGRASRKASPWCVGYRAVGHIDSGHACLQIALKRLMKSWRETWLTKSKVR